MSKKPRDNKVGPWAAEKLDALGRYLDYYTTRLKKQHHWQKVYVDAFAGPGLSEVRQRPRDDPPTTSGHFGDLLAGLGPEAVADPIEEEVRYLKGSPSVALDLRNPFDRYVFIEKDPARVTELNALAQNYGTTRKIEIRGGDANAVLLELLAGGFSKRTHRACIFLDPFGIQVPWSTMEALAKTGAIEVMINFPMGMAINRMIPRSGNVPADWAISLDTFFGTPEWHQYAYEVVTDLAGERKVKLRDSGVRLMEWYRERLRDRFGHVSEARLITNTRGGRLYYLIWAGPREEGLVGANHILTMKTPKKRSTDG